MNEKGTTERTVGRISIGLAVLNGIGLIVTVAGMLHVRGKFAAIYRDFGVQLPTLTQFVLGVSPLAVEGVALLLLAVLAAKEFLRPKTIPLVLNLVWTVAGVALVALFTVALFNPLVAVVGALAAPQ